MDNTQKSGLLHAKIFDSRITSANVKNSEKWLGYFTGPAVVSMLYVVLGTTYSCSSSGQPH